MASSNNERPKRQRQRDATPHPPPAHGTDAGKRQRLTRNESSAEPRPVSSVGVAASTELPAASASAGPGPGPSEHVATTSSHVLPQVVAPPGVLEPLELAHFIAARAAQARSFARLMQVPAMFAELHGPDSEAPDRPRVRAIVAGNALVFTSIANVIQPGGKLHRRCRAVMASAHAHPALVMELEGVQYQLSVCYTLGVVSSWNFCLPCKVPYTFTSESSPHRRYTAPLYVVEAPRAGQPWIRARGEPDGELLIDLASQLNLAEARSVATVLGGDHQRTLGGIARDVSEELIRRTHASAQGRAASHSTDTVRDCRRGRPCRMAQRKACEQMLAELRMLDECRCRMAPPHPLFPRVWDAFGYDGFRLIHAAAALGCTEVLKQLADLGASATRFSPYGTPAELVKRLGGAMWHSGACEACERTSRTTSPPVATDSHHARGAAADGHDAANSDTTTC